MKIEQLKSPGKILHQCCAALHPITAIQILYSLDAADFCPMNMAADDPVRPMLPRQLHHAFLKPCHISDRGLGILLQIRRDRPVAEAESASDPIEVGIEDQNRLVKSGSHPLEKPVELNQAVQLMAMDHQISTAIGRYVNSMGNNLDSPHIEPGEILKELIVVPMHVNDPGILAILPEDFLNDGVGIFTPVPSAFQFPAINKVSDEVEILTLILTQKLEEGAGLGVTTPQVHIRNPDRAVIHDVRESASEARTINPQTNTTSSS